MRIHLKEIFDSILVEGGINEVDGVLNPGQGIVAVNFGY